MINMNCHWDKNRECKSDFLCYLCKYQPADDDKPHGKDAPKAIIWTSEYGMTVPYCPACGKMAYSTERCVFCGQKLIDKQRHKELIHHLEGVKQEGRKITCSSCGTDLRKENALTFISHFDGEQVFGYTYRCNQCGKNIKMTIERG